MARRLRRRLTLLLMAAVVTLCLTYSSLPLESPTRLAVKFNAARLWNHMGSRHRDDWLHKPARFHLDLRSDVGYLIKTGYGTRHRLPEQLEALERSGPLLGDEGRGFLVVGDWTSVNDTDARLLGVQVHDALRIVMDRHTATQHPRLTKYKSLQAIIAAGDEERAKHVGQAYGWELDALKFMVAMELGYKQLPHKKWYMILDDDTFIVRPSLELLLSHLDPDRRHYIGNAVGDYKARFAHGGSAVVLSGAVLQALFARPDVVDWAYRQSLDETWGDRLVASTLHRIGVYLDERYSHYFNGEQPHLTRIRADRVCSPIVSFHGLRDRGSMAAVGRALGRVKKPVLWGHLWDLLAAQPLDAFASAPFKPGDHVGPSDKEQDGQMRIWTGVSDGGECSRRCARAGAQCLAWTFDAHTNQCRASPWLVVGGGHGIGRGQVVSGINLKRVEPMVRQCLLSL
ncbi:hypothetical protein CDD81_2948 [Ophiocordyceps australis]|uniref:N-acetylgalactosaminide beta-1,3-galactosyltransferase n=1 Tax=Ophiocordyceps australis TaxID=1399860 RepID=A0A2C5XCD4_9HYPO|nr:hypothetical protein CDD81_2948 [Ophiocordyceps australis]